MKLQLMADSSALRTITLVQKDLLRHFQLVHGLDSPSPTPLRLWLSVFSPRYLPVLLYRVSHCFFRHRLFVPAKLVSSLNFLIFGVEIAAACPIGPGLVLPHTQGTVIGAWRIGANVTIFQGVTIGARELDFTPSRHSRPTLGDGFTVGAGSAILGGISLGDSSRVGANSVVLKTIPAGCLAVGSPARIIPGS